MRKSSAPGPTKARNVSHWPSDLAVSAAAGLAVSKTVLHGQDERIAKVHPTLGLAPLPGGAMVIARFPASLAPLQVLKIQPAKWRDGGAPFHLPGAFEGVPCRASTAHCFGSSGP